MSSKKIYILLAIFIILSAVAFLPKISDKFKFADKKEGGLDFSSFSEQAVDKFVIKKGDDEKTLSKENNTWKLSEKNASMTAINSFFQEIQKLQTSDLISKNADNFSNLNISDDKAFIVTFYQKEKESTYYFSEMGDRYDNFYAREKGSDNVYLVKTALPEQIVYTQGEWQEKNIVSIRKEDINFVEVFIKDQEYRILHQDSDKWLVEKEKQTYFLDDEKINLLTNSLNPLEANDILNEVERKELDAYKNKNVIKVFDHNKNVTLEIYLMEKDGKYWGKVLGQNDYFVFEKYKIPDFLFNPK